MLDPGPGGDRRSRLERVAARFAVAAARRGGGHAHRLLPLRHRAGEGRDLARPAARLLLRREPRRGGGHLRPRRGPAGLPRGVLRRRPRHGDRAARDARWPDRGRGRPRLGRPGRRLGAADGARGGRGLRRGARARAGVGRRDRRAAPGDRRAVARLLDAALARPRPAPGGRFPSTSARATAASSPRSPSPTACADLRRALGGGKVLRSHEHFWVEGALAASPAAVRRCSPPRGTCAACAGAGRRRADG